MLLIDLERSVASSHIPGKQQRLKDNRWIVPRSGSVTPSVRLESKVLERSDPYKAKR